MGHIKILWYAFFYAEILGLHQRKGMACYPAMQIDQISILF